MQRRTMRALFLERCISLRNPWDLPGNLGMAAHGIDTHDAAGQVQLLQQERQRSLLIRMLCHVSLGQDQVARRGPGTHHLDRVPAGCTLMGAASCLAINGERLRGQDGVDRLHPREKTRGAPALGPGAQRRAQTSHAKECALSKSRKVSSHARLACPNSSTSTQVSAPQMTALNAMVMIANN